MTGPGDEPWRPVAGGGLLRLRAAMLDTVRRFFAARDVLEVETPLLGSHAVTDPNIPSFRVEGRGGEGDRFLQTSPEYAMKRLLAAGAGDIYQVCKAFRAGEKGARHNPEFTLIEWYRLGFDHRRLMAEVAALAAVLLDRPAHWSRRSYGEACADLAGIDPVAASSGELAGRAVGLGLDPGAAATMDRDGLLDYVFAAAVQPRLGREQFEFVDGYPPSQAALARVTVEDGQPVARRFELFYRGEELANGYHELADVAELGRRMAADRAARQHRGLVDRTPDERLLAALGAGLPDCAGVAMGLDRLVMLRSGARSVAEVLAFPYDRA